MGTKIKEFINEEYSEEKKNFYNYMINKMEELAEYSGIDTKDFNERFFISSSSDSLELESKPVQLYLYNKDDNIFNLVDFRANPQREIYLVDASATKIDLEDKSFIYHNFEYPKYYYFGINIIHKKMSGILPYHLFNPYEVYNITTGVIQKNFNEDLFSHNCMTTIHDVIEFSRNQKEFIDSDDFMWETNQKYNFDLSLEYGWPEIYPIIKDMPLEEAKRFVLKNPTEIKGIDSLFKMLELKDYKKRYDEHYKNKTNIALKYIMPKQN